MEQVNMQEIEELMEFFRFDGFGGPERNVEHLCEARDIGMTTFVECLEQNLNRCPNALSYGDSWYCSSRARVHITKGLRM
jgi:hypothetical protein